MPMPPTISEMVATAPAFEQLAEQVLARLSDVVFVAHNARFDYNFLRAAFERLDMQWTAPVLCTVKFSRRGFLINSFIILAVALLILAILPSSAAF